jgi:hypothetical protein
MAGWARTSTPGTGQLNSMAMPLGSKEYREKITLVDDLGDPRNRRHQLVLDLHRSSRFAPPRET